jgi:xanthine dehydrogenase YagS FAD-binding subunit
MNMKSFSYLNPKGVTQASEAVKKDPTKRRFIAGGMDLLGQVKDEIFQPDMLVNVKTLPGMDEIKVTSDGIEIGALVKLHQVAEHPEIQKNYTAVAEAAAEVGSIQMRNSVTVGGNLCQRPRCWYFRHNLYNCLKKGGEYCYAMAGENRYHAVLGGSPCYIIHPSDLAPALVALDAVAVVEGVDGAREVPLEKFYHLPETHPHWETDLAAWEMVTGVKVPAPTSGTKSRYTKFREKDSMDFALVAAAVRLTLSGGSCSDSRIVLGGVAPKPWRSTDAENVLSGKNINEALAKQAGEAALKGAEPLGQNAYKVPLAKVITERTILAAAGIKVPA